MPCYKRGMINPFTAASQLSDQELLVEVSITVAREREVTARLVALLAQLDSRRLYLGEGCSSLFTYCTQVLRLSEHAAYGRIEAARATRKFPELLNLLTDGSITLTTVTLLSSTSSRAYVRRWPCSAVHRDPRDARQAASRPGSVAALDSKR
jgi:hypothetical protein